MSQMPGGPNLNEGPIESEPKEIDINANRKGLDKIALGSCQDLGPCISYKDLLIFGAFVGGAFYVNRKYNVKWWVIIVGAVAYTQIRKSRPKMEENRVYGTN